MTTDHRRSALSRRRLLGGVAAAGAAVFLSACSRSGGEDGALESAAPTEPAGTPADQSPSPAAETTPSAVASPESSKGSATTPLDPPATLREAPALAAQVKAGKLPPVAERLPAEPYVLPHNWVRRGNYGGAMKINITSTSGDTSVGEWFYDYSPLRYLNDSRTIGPGIVSKWKSNADASRWEFTLRKGLKWSDGHPVTTDDVLFWWNDMANDDDYTAEAVPDEGKSGKGTICKLTAKDERTWVMDFDAPAPLTVDRLAMWSNGYGGNGASWIVPSHYVKQFHPKYNPKVPKNWSSPGGIWEQKASYRRNPKCPTLAPFQLARYSDAKSLTWERNPYCYVVTRDGDQLPYLDQIVMTQVADPEVGKLQIASGRVDYCHGPYNAVTLADVSTLNKGAQAAGIRVLMWDSGSGTASMFFLNHDYHQAKYRKLFREPRFSRALSYAYNRDQARTAVYFNTGEPTTGTMSPKAAEFVVNDEGRKRFEQWRDAYVRFDPAKANKLLDELGLKDIDGDGRREFPDGSKLRLRIELPASANNEYVQTSNQRARDWKAVGIDAVVTPVPPDGFNDEWSAGRYMSRSAWEVGGGPNIIAQPQWIVPMENSRWAPLQGQMYASRGTSAYTSEKDVDPWKRKPPRVMPEAGGAVDRLWTLVNRAKVEVDVMKRTAIVWKMIKVHVDDGPFFQGTVVNPPQPIVVKNGLSNVPTRENLFLGGFVNPWTHPVPAAYDVGAYFWDEPDKHQL